MTFFKTNIFEDGLNNRISIRDLTQFDTKQILDNLANDEIQIIYEKKKPLGAWVSLERLEDLLEKEEDLNLINLAMNRDVKTQKYISSQEFYDEIGYDDSEFNILPVLEME